MTEQLISFKTAKLAKEKGFDIRQLNSYTSKGVFQSLFGDYDWVHYGTNSILAPTQSLLQKWLREKYNLLIIPLPTSTTHFTFVVTKIGDGNCMPFKSVAAIDYSTYEEALEKGLQEALKLNN